MNRIFVVFYLIILYLLSIRDWWYRNRYGMCWCQWYLIVFLMLDCLGSLLFILKLCVMTLSFTCFCLLLCWLNEIFCSASLFSIAVKQYFINCSNSWNKIVEGRSYLSTCYLCLQLTSALYRMKSNTWIARNSDRLVYMLIKYSDNLTDKELYMYNSIFVYQLSCRYFVLLKK